ncbi:MAG: hypothetical protein WB052_01840 [Pseudolabrys sp.]
MAITKRREPSCRHCRITPRKQTFVIAAARLDLECIATRHVTNLEASSPLGVRLLTKWSVVDMVDGDLRDQIARLESDIEQLAEGLERCRKAMLLSKGAIAAGGICILAYFLGIRFEPTIVIGALAAIVGGVVGFGSNSSTAKQTMAAMKVAEAQRTELIGMIDLRSVGSRNGRQAIDS